MDITSFLIGKEVGGGSAPTPTYQDKEITITQNGEQTITADEGYDALSSVEITTNVPAGADLSDYFASTIGAGQSTYSPSYVSIFKKIPMLTASGSSLRCAFSLWSLEGCPIPDVDARNVNNYEECCGNIPVHFPNNTADFSNWLFPNESNLGMTLRYFVSGSSYIENIDLSSMGKLTTNYMNCESMFEYSQNLKKVDLSNLDNSNQQQTNIKNLFSQCSSLEEVDMSKFDFTNTYNYDTAFRNIPTNCLIYVKDQTQKDWFTTNWSGLTNVQIKGA